MDKVLSNSIFTSIILPIIIAYITTDITVTFERNKMVYELRRTTYMKTLKLLSEIEENKEIIFDKNFFHQMKECSLEMEVYASKSIAQKFFELWREISEKHIEYYAEFEDPVILKRSTELTCADKKQFDQLREKASIYYMQTNFVIPEKVFELSCHLKDAILVSLRRG